ncbi:hypothetical protein KUTeg_024340 [Tegillarca granosa]|uniref:VWFD domain-containing protein n=1 Tax=Tegillarca granosa TaxID=220873 RepID=A0ABQ9E145_TEGGR|nr:hypothetical protein KUTeg_024340 [Tegillarca granosa]
MPVNRKASTLRKSAVVNTDSGPSKIQSNFTIIMKNGIGIQAADKDNVMFVNIYIPPNMKNQVFGLLGNWNDNITDDLLPSESTTPAQAGDIL